MVEADDSLGVVYVSAYGLTPLSTCIGNILEMSFHVPVGVSPGTSDITVAASPHGGLNGGALVLTTVDGSVVVASKARRQRGRSKSQP